MAAVLFAPVAILTIDNLVDRSNLHLSSTAADQEQCALPPTLEANMQFHRPVLVETRPPDLSGDNASSRQEIQGRATMPYGFDIGMDVETLETSRGYCVRLSRVSIASIDRAPEVWLTPGLRPGTCRYDLTMEHELKHVLNFHDHLRRVEAEFLEQVSLQPGLRSGRMVSGNRDAGRAAEDLRREVLGLIEEIDLASYRIAAARDDALDTPEERRRIRRACRHSERR